MCLLLLFTPHSQIHGIDDEIDEKIAHDNAFNVRFKCVDKTKLIFIKTDNAVCRWPMKKIMEKSINNAKRLKRPLSPFKMQQMSEPIFNHHLIFCRAI